MSPKTEVWQGTLALMILKTLETMGAQHGYGIAYLLYGIPIGAAMGTDKADVWQGTLALMILKTLETMGEQHGYGVARRIEQTSGDRLSVNYGTIYPALLKLEQEGYIESDWGVSDNNRRAKFYHLTAAGRRRLGEETASWQRLVDAIAMALRTTPQEI